MILKRYEITLVGPDEYPADEGSYAIWEAEEKAASRALEIQLGLFLYRTREQLSGSDFEIEISPESDAPAPSGASDGF